VQEALRLQPSEATAYFLLAHVHGARGEWSEAEKALDTAEALDPRFANPGIWRLRAGAEHRKGNVDAAIRLWERCRQAGPLRLPSRLYLIDHYETAGDLPGAREIAGEIRSRRPDAVPLDVERVVRALAYKPRPVEHCLRGCYLWASNGRRTRARSCRRCTRSRVRPGHTRARDGFVRS
jgi:tetratricopeptide (TPR) repeat protein